MFLNFHSPFFSIRAAALAILLSGCGGSDSSASNNHSGSSGSTSTTSPSTTGKKGFGLAENGIAQSNPGLNQADFLKRLKVDWFYSWGTSTNVITSIEFVPMSFGLSGIDKLPASNKVVMGFNEPDNSKQSNLTVQTALDNWSRLSAKSTTLVSPATAGNPLNDGAWLKDFVAGSPSPRLDAVAVHWYKGPDAKKFKSDIQAICDLYKKPVWVTEFAPQTVSSATAEPNKYAQEQVNSFVVDVIAWMNSNSCVARFAWHDAKQGTSALLDTATGQLTPTGIAYSLAQ